MKTALSLIVTLILSVNASEIDLECYTDYIYHNGRNIKSCTVQNLIATSPDDVLVSVNGDNKTTDYEGIVILSQILHFLPKQFGKFFPKVKRLTIQHSGLESIEKKNMEAFTEINFLDLSSNKLTSLDGDLFEFNPDLYHVNFNSNKLRNIGEDLLDHLTKLQQAYFYDNVCIQYSTNYGHSISSINDQIRDSCPSIKDLKRKYCTKDIQALESKVKELEFLLEVEKSKGATLYTKCDGTLDIATEQLMKVSKQAKSCSKVEERVSEDAENPAIDLVVEQIAILDDNSSIEAVAMRVESPGQSIRTMKFDQSTSLLVGNQTSFSVVHQQTLYFPINLGDHLPQLQKLLIFSSGLFEIDARIFETIPALIELAVIHNKLQEVPADTFNNLKNLTALNLSFNNIRSLEKAVFKELGKLKFLELDHNLISTVDAVTFEHLKALEFLALNDNKLKFISANLITPMTKLTKVKLTNNACIDMEHPKSSLAAIEAKIIDSCIAPIELQCKIEEPAADDETKKSGGVCKPINLIVSYPKTKISTIKGNFSTDVTVLSISSQQTLYLPFKLSQTFPKLEKIVVEHSKMTALMKQDFDGLKLMKHIAITFNNISFIEEGTFDDVTQLEHLDLASNNIKSLPNKLFSPLNQLRILILSDNLLTKFTANLLPPKNAIEEFQIRNNQLELIETKTLRFLRKAKLIDITENVCIDMKYEKAKNNSRALVELSGEIDLNCSEDDMRR